MVQGNEINAHASNKNTNKNYGAENIRVLEGLEAVRERPGMYIGSTSERGLHHLVWEVVDNSVDEALAGYATKVDVTILKDGGIRVVDDGRGIPVDPQTKGTHKGKSTLEVVLTVLHAGGKFGDGAYAVSGGLHGVGISVVNALSKRVEVEVKSKGYLWKQAFVGDLGLPEKPVEKCEKITEEETGTSVTFWADDKIFETTEYNFDTLKNRFQQMAFLNKGLKITLTDQREHIKHNSITDIADKISETKEEKQNPEQTKQTTVSFYYEKGLTDYVHHLNKVKKAEIIHEEIIEIETEQKEPLISMEIAMQWTTAYSEGTYTFANTIATTEGGTHEEGFKTALTSTMNRYAKEKQILKDKDENLSGEDFREGLTAVISVKIGNPQFEGQTKTKLGNSEVKGFVQKNITEKLKEWLEEHPKEAKNIIAKALSAAKARKAAQNARENTRRKSIFESASMPDKLKDCQSSKASECEIFIVEGDSAGGSAVQGRNPYNQAILPLRGKILNVEKVSSERAFSSDTIQSLITAIGAGTKGSFDPAKARYHKIVLMADADVDGQHIATLLLTFLFRFMKPLIELGYVYLAQPPLYRIKWSGKPHDYVFSDEERDEAVSRGYEKGWKLPKEAIQRYKGLGEMSYNELWETTMDPEKRTLLQVTMDDAAAADEVFSLLMGEDVSARRNFIQTNAKDVRFLDI